MTTVPQQFENAQAKSKPNSDWTVGQSHELYGISGWGGNYFDIDADGDVTVAAPTSNGSQSVAMSTIIDGLNQRGLKTPVMLRIENLIDDRVVRLNEVFAKAIADANYQGDYRAVFPIKVNQQHNVVDSIMRSGQHHRRLEPALIEPVNDGRHRNRLTAV